MYKVHQPFFFNGKTYFKNEVVPDSTAEQNLRFVYVDNQPFPNSVMKQAPKGVILRGNKTNIIDKRK